ncbi:hypothetical protein TNIN_393761 [Trichonephila inaurata madagascariensis]|uniref:Uncharacterized protein n=1 Tax=Trichonephila inaurata madagascariensis TaxID=2747483 RepID=A0A8X6Y814_9ARAC|nr:hypothetical protein TNIN_393761 [Trichonephila inaurata madagascariensis]
MLVAVHIIRAHSDSEHFALPSSATNDKRNFSCWFPQAPSEQTSPSFPLEYFATSTDATIQKRNFECWSLPGALGGIFLPPLGVFGLPSLCHKREEKLLELSFTLIGVLLSPTVASEIRNSA